MRPNLIANEVAGPFELGRLAITPFEQSHGFAGVTTGFRFGSAAYTTDAWEELSEQALATLEGVQCWVVDCLRFEPHPTHAHFDRTLEWIALVKPQRAILAHMSHALDYESLRRRCPPSVEPAYDGMVLDIDE